MIRLLSFLSLCLAVAGGLPAAELVFNAMLTTGGENRYVLISPEGRTSGWLRDGQEFEGVTILGYDYQTEELRVRSTGQELRLAMASARIAESKGEPATLAQATDLLEQMRFREMMQKTLEPQLDGMRKMIEQMFAQMKLPPEEMEHFVAYQEDVMAVMSNRLVDDELTSDMAQVYARLFTKEELGAMSAFYATPTGKSLLEKQPAMKEEMMQLITPRLARIMPQVQQLTAKFQREAAERIKAQKLTESP